MCLVFGRGDRWGGYRGIPQVDKARSGFIPFIFVQGRTSYQIFNAGRPIEAVIAELRETLRLSKAPIIVEFGPDTGKEHLSELGAWQN